MFESFAGANQLKLHKMKIKAEQREVNILSHATALGFTPEPGDDYRDVIATAVEFIEANGTIDREEMADLSTHTNHEYLSWSDGKGYDFWEQGEITSPEQWRALNDGDKYYLSTVIDSNGLLVHLFLVK